ncbi:MAG TPA: hypothetical protein VGD84_16325 [Pseudonocardiaceae bacterium]
MTDRKWPASAALIGVWLAAALLAMHTEYVPWVLILLVCNVLLILGSVWLGAFRAVPSTAAVVAVTLATPLVLIGTPLFMNAGRTAWLLPAVIAGGVVVPLGLLALFRPWLALVVLGLTAAVFGGVIMGGVPRIDVWVILQDVANGLSHYQNPYGMRFPNVPAGETASCFNYLPSTFLMTAPGDWLFGDVRWVEAGCVLGAAALLGWHVGRRRGLPLALLVAGLPGTLLVVQQAWTEPMLLVLLCVAAVAVDRGGGWLALVAVGVALANKQHAVVLLPFLLLYKDFGPRRTVLAGVVGAAVTVPWVLMDPVRFKTCVADFYLAEPAPAASVSIWRWLPAGWGLPVLLLGTAAVTVLALRRCPRGGAGLLLGCGLVLLTFDLLNKQTFLNQWWLAASLLLAGMAGSTVEPKPGNELSADEQVTEDVVGPVSR